jgi:hypothetical protein
MTANKNGPSDLVVWLLLKCPEEKRRALAQMLRKGDDIQYLADQIDPDRREGPKRGRPKEFDDMAVALWVAIRVHLGQKRGARKLSAREFKICLSAVDKGLQSCEVKILRFDPAVLPRMAKAAEQMCQLLAHQYARLEVRTVADLLIVLQRKNSN